MTKLEHAIKHIKTRADAWAVKEVTEALQSISERLDKALSQEPMREFTEEEAKAYSKALDKMYKPTGFNVFNEPCDDAVSREELLKAIDTWDKFGVDDTNSLFRLDNLSLPYYVPYIHYDDVIKCIKGMPSVTQSGKWIDGVHAMGYREGYKDAQKQKSGKWIEELDDFGEVTKYHCSECYEDTGFVTDCKWKFCPNCGSVMKGE